MSERLYGDCYVCNAELCGTVIEVNGRHYHNRCFYCCKCRKQLGKEEFRMRDERFFCISCYSKAFERICAECGEYIIDDKFIEALNSSYHCDHFVCFLCKKGLPGSKFVKKEIYYHGEQATRPFCRACHDKVKKMTCAECHHLLGEVKAFDNGTFYHDFCWLRNHPEEDVSGDRIREAQARMEREEKRLKEERRKEEERMREERMREEKQRIEEERRMREEEKRRREEEKERKKEEERKRIEEESKRRDEERKKREEERRAREEEMQKREEEEQALREEERKRREEEKRQREEEERQREEERKREQKRREMLETYRTKDRQVDFNSDDEYQPIEEAKPQKVVPSVPPAPPKPRYTRSAISEMLAESYAPMKGNYIEEATNTGDLARSTYYVYPQYEDYKAKDKLHQGMSPSENKQAEEPAAEDVGDEVDEVRASVMKYENVDEEYMEEQQKVKELSNDELKKYPYSVLKTQPLPKDVDPNRREYHLTDEEFEEVFKMDKKMYESQPRWKRNDMRKKADLF